MMLNPAQAGVATPVGSMANDAMSAEPTTGQKRPLTILVVDDSRVDREMVSRLLAGSDDPPMIVQGVPTAEDGLAWCRRERPDCILVDYRLPEMNGAEFLEFLADGLGDSAFPVIMMTGAGGEGVAVAAMKAGAADYLIKGEFDATRLVSSIRAAVDKHRMRTEIQQYREDLERSNADLRTYARTISDDLRVPLAAVLNSLERIGDRVAERLDARDHAEFEHVLASLRLMADRIVGLLELAKIDETVEFGSVELARTWRLALAAVEAKLGFQPVHVEQGDLPHLPGSQPLLVTLFESIVSWMTSTARRYGQLEPGRLTIDARPQATFWRVRVAAEGVNVSNDERARTSRLLQSPSGAEDLNHVGSVPLILCRRIAEIHGGSVWLEGDQAGCALVVLLPQTEASTH